MMLQTLKKIDDQRFKIFKQRTSRGIFPPIEVKFLNQEVGFVVITLSKLKSYTFIAEYSGDVQFDRKVDKSNDSLMRLLQAQFRIGNSNVSLTICPSTTANHGRFFSSIDSTDVRAKKKGQNVRNFSLFFFFFLGFFLSVIPSLLTPK
jgi:hypothetical protein